MIPLNGEVFLKFAEATMKAIELVPDDKKDTVLWQGQFPGKDGQPRELKSQTPHELAVDIIQAMSFFTRAGKGELTWDSVDPTEHAARIAALAKLSMKDLAQEGRRKAAETAALIDTLPQDDWGRIMKAPSGAPFTALDWATLEFAHMIHHRGQLFWCLRAMGIKPPAFLQ